MNNDKFIIVKYLGGNNLETKRTSLPRLPISESAFDTFSGTKVGIKESYDSEEEALKDCEKINEFNPSCYYDIAIAE